MATGYLQKHTAGRNSEFVQKVAISLSKAALAKTTEGGFPSSHLRVKRLVKTILTDPDQLADTIALNVAANSPQDNGSLDADIQSVIDSNFEKLAWIFHEDDDL